ADDQRLVGYVVPAGGSDPCAFDTEALTESVRERLPDYMVPSAIVPLASFPATPSGKLDRGALPAPGPTEAPVGRGPRTPDEEVLCRLFADLLGVDEIGVDADFFDQGGHSLLATRLVGRIRAEFDVDVKVTTVFRNPTVAQLADRIRKQTRSSRPRLRQMTVEENRR
ncbi:phosphopantetheine-binding protein, partial [Streptomyces sp. bgisy153]